MVSSPPPIPNAANAMFYSNYGAPDQKLDLDMVRGKLFVTDSFHPDGNRMDLEVANLVVLEGRKLFDKDALGRTKNFDATAGRAIKDVLDIIHTYLSHGDKETKPLLEGLMKNKKATTKAIQGAADSQIANYQTFIDHENEQIKHIEEQQQLKLDQIEQDLEAANLKLQEYNKLSAQQTTLKAELLELKKQSTEAQTDLDAANTDLKETQSKIAAALQEEQDLKTATQRKAEIAQELDRINTILGGTDDAPKAAAKSEKQKLDAESQQIEAKLAAAASKGDVLTPLHDRETDLKQDIPGYEKTIKDLEPAIVAKDAEILALDPKIAAVQSSVTDVPALTRLKTTTAQQTPTLTDPHRAEIVRYETAKSTIEAKLKTDLDAADERIRVTKSRMDAEDSFQIELNHIHGKLGTTIKNYDTGHGMWPIKATKEKVDLNEPHFQHPGRTGTDVFAVLTSKMERNFTTYFVGAHKIRERAESKLIQRMMFEKDRYYADGSPNFVKVGEMVNAQGMVANALNAEIAAYTSDCTKAYDRDQVRHKLNPLRYVLPQKDASVKEELSLVGKIGRKVMGMGIGAAAGAFLGIPLGPVGMIAGAGIGAASTVVTKPLILRVAAIGSAILFLLTSGSKFAWDIANREEKVSDKIRNAADKEAQNFISRQYNKFMGIEEKPEVEKASPRPAPKPAPDQILDRYNGNKPGDVLDRYNTKPQNNGGDKPKGNKEEKAIKGLTSENTYETSPKPKLEWASKVKDSTAERRDMLKYQSGLSYTDAASFEKQQKENAPKHLG